MSEVKPEAGAPQLFYCKHINDKGGPCHAPDCAHRIGCVLLLKKKQHTKDGKTVTGSFQVYHHLWVLWQMSSERSS